jgi:hypothetical protein
MSDEFDNLSNVNKTINEKKEEDKSMFIKKHNIGGKKKIIQKTTDVPNVSSENKKNVIKPIHEANLKKSKKNQQKAYAVFVASNDSPDCKIDEQVNQDNSPSVLHSREDQPAYMYDATIKISKPLNDYKVQAYDPSQNYADFLSDEKVTKENNDELQIPIPISISREIEKHPVQDSDKFGDGTCVPFGQKITSAFNNWIDEYDDEQSLSEYVLENKQKNVSKDNYENILFKDNHDNILKDNEKNTSRDEKEYIDTFDKILRSESFNEYMTKIFATQLESNKKPQEESQNQHVKEMLSNFGSMMIAMSKLIK